MNEEQKMIAEIAARFYEAHIRAIGSVGRDEAQVNWCIKHATSIVLGSMSTAIKVKS